MRVLLNKASSKIQFFETFARIGHDNRTYIHKNEITLINDIYAIKVKDLKYNRHSTIKHIEDSVKGLLSSMVYQVFDYNVVSPLTIFTYDMVGEQRFRYMIILSDLTLVMPMTLSKSQLDTNPQNF